MGTAHLNVWLAKIEDPCRIIDETDEDGYAAPFVHILHCDGTPLTWCGTTYLNQEMKCGHAEIEVPPGCYLVLASRGRAPGEGKTLHLGNHLSHVAIVRVNCGDHACVTLFQPSAHTCVHWLRVALEEHVAHGGVDRAAGQEAIRALEQLVETLPEDPLTQNMIAAIPAPPPDKPRGRKTAK